MEDNGKFLQSDISEVMSRFTTLNNELLNAKRQLTKNNIELTRLRQELQDKNQELQSLNEELEKRVWERTQQLTLVLDEINDFAFSLSHDLRTPLRGIDGFSSLLMEDYAETLDSQAINYLESIKRDARKLGEVLDALHSLSNVSRKDLVMVKTNLSVIAEHVMEHLISKYPGRKIEYVIQPDLFDICDRELMTNALSNLLSNAVKFTKLESVAKVEFGKVSENNTDIYFVKDNGIGFNMEYVNKLFHSFQRLHQYNAFEGIGIGLATVRRIVLKHGGAIWAASEPEKGSTFCFTISGSKPR